MRIAVAHEWIERHGGAERVVDQIVECLEDPEIFTLWDDAPGRYPTSRVHESFLAESRLRSSKAAALPLMSYAWRSFDLRGIDALISSSHAFAHHIGSGRQQQHITHLSYVHTPARWLWAREYDPRGGRYTNVAAPLAQRFDRRRHSAASVAANSHFVKDRIRNAWNVESEVIYPPVQTQELATNTSWADVLTIEEQEIFDSLPPDFILGASRFVEYKRLDVVINFAATVGRPVVIAGGGPDERRLRELAAESQALVTFVIRPSDTLLRALMQEAEVFVYPPVEDFGIMPVEANALGTRTIVNAIGGAAESAALTGGGVPVNFEDHASWPAAFDAAVADSEGMRTRAHERFSAERFRSELARWAQEHGLELCP